MFTLQVSPLMAIDNIEIVIYLDSGWYAPINEDPFFIDLKYTANEKYIYTISQTGYTALFNVFRFYLIYRQL